MSAEPLSREERENFARGCEASACDGSCALARYEATVQDVEAKLADCERRERAAVERAEALANAIDCHVSLTAQGRGGGTSLLRAALAADDEARAT